MLERTDEFAALVTREMGKRIQEADGEVQLAASILDYYAQNGPRFLEPRTIEVRQGEAVVRTSRSAFSWPSSRGTTRCTRWCGWPGRTWCWATRSCSSTPS